MQMMHLHAIGYERQIHKVLPGSVGACILS